MSNRISLLLCVLVVMTGAQSVCGQTVLFDFEEGPQGWGSFGAITTDKGNHFDGSVGFGQFHAADFSVPDTGNFGIVDVSPPGQNLSTFGGLSVDARFVDLPGFEPFVGVRDLDIIVATGDDSNEEEFFAPKQTMTDVYQTFSVQFSQFTSAVDQQPPTIAELANVRIKFVVLNANGTGQARFDYDQVAGVAAVTADADFDNDSDVDGADFLIWQRNFLSGTTNAQGDANGTLSVNSADFSIWADQFGAVGAAAAVPEPSACIMLLTSVAALARHSRRSSLRK